MALDDQLRGRIEVVLRAYALPGREDHTASHADRITHLAKIVMCVEIHPPPRPSRKRGERGASTLALQAFMEGLCIAYADLTGKQPTRSTKCWGFREFVMGMDEATGWLVSMPKEKDKPWEALGMSRATWCRYGKPDKLGKPSPKLRGAVSKQERDERRKRLAYAVQLACEKYKNRKLIFSSQ
jgi:hypothetical protein